MISSSNVAEALQLYSRGLISRNSLERDLADWDQQAHAPHRSRFWTSGTQDLQQDGSGTWKVREGRH